MSRILTLGAKLSALCADKNLRFCKLSLQFCAQSYKVRFKEKGEEQK